MKIIMKTISARVPLELYNNLKSASRNLECPQSLIIRKGLKRHLAKINAEQKEDI